MDIKIIIAAHKKSFVPQDDIYLPLQVGAGCNAEIGFTKDNTGDNISNKNPAFCELTGLYFAWKNLKCDYLGLVHYRRYFKGGNHGRDIMQKVLSRAETEKLLKKCDIILPKKRNYYIETLYSHYEHTMYVEPLDITGQIIKENHPEYFSEFERLKKRRSAHIFNMFIMKKEISDKYCKWLFDILFELERRMDKVSYDPFHARFYGRISELLLDVYLNTNGLSFAEVPVLYTEPINWRKKITGFLKAKFFGKKYNESF